MALTTVNLALEEMERNGVTFGTLKESYAALPTSTKKALAEKFVHKVEGFADEKLLGYSAEQQEIDSRRVLFLQDALSALEHLEAELVRTQVLDLADILWKRYRVMRSLYEALHVSWSSFWKITIGLWNYVTGATLDQASAALAELEAGVVACAAIVAEILSAKAFLKVALTVIKTRNECIATMRRKALPQPPAKRYRRRKRAR